MRPADAAKRVGMSEAEFRSVNAIPPRVVIKAGSSLLVPRSHSLDQDVTVKLADHGQLSLAPEIVSRKTLARAGKGDTVAAIARRFKVNVDQVAQWNKVSVTASFKPGQQVVVFQPPATASRKAASSAKSPVRRATSGTGRSAPTRNTKR